MKYTNDLTMFILKCGCTSQKQTIYCICSKTYFKCQTNRYFRRCL